MWIISPKFYRTVPHKNRAFTTCANSVGSKKNDMLLYKEDRGGKKKHPTPKKINPRLESLITLSDHWGCKRSKFSAAVVLQAGMTLQALKPCASQQRCDITRPSYTVKYPAGTARQCTSLATKTTWPRWSVGNSKRLLNIHTLITAILARSEPQIKTNI